MHLESISDTLNSYFSECLSFSLSVVVDDGTAQAHLQIEQSLFHRFLALPAAHWLLVLEAAKCEELTYPREIDSDIQQNFSLPVVSTVSTYLPPCARVRSMVLCTEYIDQCSSRVHSV